MTSPSSGIMNLRHVHRLRFNASLLIRLLRCQLASVFFKFGDVSITTRFQNVRQHLLGPARVSLAVSVPPLNRR